MPGGPPAGERNEGRRTARRSGAGLLLSYTRISRSRSSSDRTSNPAVELRDIGWGGLKFVASEPLLPPCEVSLRVRDPATGDEFRAQGDVRWEETQEAGGRELHLVGVRFGAIYTPIAKCAHFLQESPGADPGAPPIPDARNPRRKSDRFAVDNHFVSVCRQGHRDLAGTRVNVARRLVDLSAVGAQVVCSDHLEPGTVVRFMLHLNRFLDSLAVSADVVWCRREPPDGARTWSVGLKFGPLDRPTRELLDTIMRRPASDRGG